MAPGSRGTAARGIPRNRRCSGRFPTSRRRSRPAGRILSSGGSESPTTGFCPVPEGPGRGLSVPSPVGRKHLPSATRRRAEPRGKPPAPRPPQAAPRPLPGRALCRCWGPCSCRPELSPAPRPPPWPAAWARPQPAARRRPPLPRRGGPHGPSPLLAARSPAWSPPLCPLPAAAAAIHSVAARPRPDGPGGPAPPPAPPPAAARSGERPLPRLPSPPGRPPLPAPFLQVRAGRGLPSPGAGQRGPGPAGPLALAPRRSEIAAGGGRRAAPAKGARRKFPLPNPRRGKRAGAVRRPFPGAVTAAVQVCAAGAGGPGPSPRPGAARGTQPPPRCGLCPPSSARRAAGLLRRPKVLLSLRPFPSRSRPPHPRQPPHAGGHRASRVLAHTGRLQRPSSRRFSSLGVTLG